MSLDIENALPSAAGLNAVGKISKGRLLPGVLLLAKLSVETTNK